jgi:Zn-dependent protease
MFDKAWNLGSIDGIKIRLHWSFLLLPAFVFFSNLTGGNGAAFALVSVVFVLAVFACVLLHELGHALAARQFGIGTRDIILLPIGGVASLERMPRNPFQELWIAVAGPLVNVVIAATVFIGLQYASLPANNLFRWFLNNLVIANTMLVVFNMIPAFPMDGGRVFRSLLAIFFPFSTATSIAVSVGKFCAIAMGLYGLFSGHLMLVLLAAFVYMVGQAELTQVLRGNKFQPELDSNYLHLQQQNAHRAESSLFQFSDNSELPFGQSEISVPSSLSVDSVAAWLNNMRADWCNVMESGRIIGRLSRSQLLAALARGFGSLPVRQVLLRTSTSR